MSTEATTVENDEASHVEALNEAIGIVEDYADDGSHDPNDASGDDGDETDDDVEDSDPVPAGDGLDADGEGEPEEEEAPDDTEEDVEEDEEEEEPEAEEDDAEEERRSLASHYAEIKRKRRSVERQEAALKEREESIEKDRAELEKAATNFGSLFRKMDEKPQVFLREYCKSRGVDYYDMIRALSYEAIDAEEGSKELDGIRSRVSGKRRDEETASLRDEVRAELEQIRNDAKDEAFLVRMDAALESGQYELLSEYEDQDELRQTVHAVYVQNGRRVSEKAILKRLEEHLEFEEFKARKNAPEGRPRPDSGEPVRRRSVVQKTISQSKTSGTRNRVDREYSHEEALKEALHGFA